MSAKLIRLFDDFAGSLVEKDIEKLIALFTDDARYVIPQFKLVYAGKDQIRQFMSSEFARIEDYTCEKLFVCEEDNKLVVDWKVHYRDNVSNKTFDDEGVTLIEAKNGLIHFLKEYLDTSRKI